MHAFLYVALAGCDAPAADHPPPTWPCKGCLGGNLIEGEQSQMQMEADWPEPTEEELITVEGSPPPSLDCPMHQPSSKSCKGCVVSAELVGSHVFVAGVPSKVWSTTLTFESGAAFVTDANVDHDWGTSQQVALPEDGEFFGALIGGEVFWYEPDGQALCCDYASEICYKYDLSIMVSVPILVVTTA